MPLLPWEKTITCPYNISHQITEGRLQRHLVKCRRNHPNADVVICEFNSSHHIPSHEEKSHLQTCPDRKLVEKMKYELRLEDKKPAPFKPADHGALDDEEEDWEREAIIKTSYDPKKKSSELPVLRKLEGATKGQRKEFRANERARHESLDSENVGKIGSLRRPKVDGRASARDGAGSRMISVGSNGSNQQLGRGSGIKIGVRSQQMFGGEQGGRGSARAVHTGAGGVDSEVMCGRGGKGRGRIVWGYSSHR